MPNIYLTPNFIETQRQKGILPNVIADFISRQVPEIAPEVQTMKQKYVNNDAAMNSYLDWKVYGTSQPAQRFFPKQESVKEELGFFSKASSYLRAPSAAFSGGVHKLLGVETADTRNLQENLKKSASTARVVLPVAAGLATMGTSIPVSAAISGAVGAGSSLLARGLESVGGEDQTLGGAAGEAATTGVVSAALDAVTMGLFKLAKPVAKGLEALKGELSSMVGKVVQSTPDDIAKGIKSMQSIDTTGVKTYSDLKNVITNKLKSLIPAQDEIFDTVPGVKKLDELATTVKVGQKTAKDNFVKTALDNLEELYMKKMQTADILRIQNLRELAKTQGISARQINDIAREYGKGFRAFSDATGQPLTSVNAGLYETVRKGLKNVSRGLMPNDAAKAIDEQMSNLINTEGLIQDMVDKVQILSNKVTMRPLGDKIGSFIGKVLNKISFNTLGGFFRGMLPSNEGIKQLNSLQIQKHLPKNLKLIDKLINQIDTLPEGQIINRLKVIFGDVLEQGTRAVEKSAIGVSTNALNE